MISFELGNARTIEELTLRDFVFGKFVFRRDHTRYRLFLGEYKSHPDLVRGLSLITEDEIAYNHIWGGGNFGIEERQLRFSGSSSYYGKVPNSFLIAFCSSVRIPNIERLVIALTPYDLEDPQLEDRRKTWRDIGGFELDTERKEYVFDKDMKLISEMTLT